MLPPYLPGSEIEDIVYANDPHGFLVVDHWEVRVVLLAEQVKNLAECRLSFCRDEVGGIYVLNGENAKKRLDLRKQALRRDDAAQRIALEHRKHHRAASHHQSCYRSDILVGIDLSDVPDEAAYFGFGMPMGGIELSFGDESLVSSILDDDHRLDAGLAKDSFER